MIDVFFEKGTGQGRPQEIQSQQDINIQLQAASEVPQYLVDAAQGTPFLIQNSLKNESGKSINDKFRRVIEGNYVNGEIRDVNRMYKELFEVYREFNQDEPASLALHNVLDILKEMAKAEEGAVFKSILMVTKNISRPLAIK